MKELRDAFDKLVRIHALGVAEQAGNLDGKTGMRMHAFRTVARKPYPAEVRSLAGVEQVIFRELMIDAGVPLRIAWGYGKWKRETTLRDNVIKVLGRRIRLVSQLPNLVICGEEDVRSSCSRLASLLEQLADRLTKCYPASLMT